MREPDPMTDADPARSALRQRMRTLRTKLPASIRLAAADGLASALRSHPALSTAGLVAGYWAVQGEIPLHALLSPPVRFTYCLPCLAPGAGLRFAAWRMGGALRPNRFGIPEPEVDEDQLLAPAALDVVLVPLLAFDHLGSRIGSGGGYYDRSFAFLQGQPRPARPLLIGVGYAFQQVEQVPAADWDVALDLVATEAGLIDCSAARDSTPA